MPMAVAMILSMTISIAMAVTMFILVTVPVVVVGIAVLFLFSVVIAVIVPVLGAIVAAVELLFPAIMAPPVRAFVVAGEGAAIAIARIEMAIVISAETYRTGEPGASSDKYAGLKPLRPIVSERCALVRLVIEVPIRARRSVANVDVDADLRVCLL
jgi:hypothetical protein